MAHYRYVIADTSSGHNLAELALTPVAPFTRVLNGIGSFQATMLLDDPKCTPANLDGDRELTIYRGQAVGDPLETAVWNGPVTNLNPVKSSGVVTVGFREATWYLYKRVLEQTKNFNADLYYQARWLFNYALAKESNGLISGGTSINAPIPRFTISPATGNSGTTKAYAWNASSRPRILDLIDQMVQDPTTGLEYMMAYSSTSRQWCNRTFTLGSPSLGTTRTQQLTEHVLSDYGYVSDRERAANRAHTVGSGYTYTLQNFGSIANNDSLIEEVYDRTDLANLTAIQNYTRDARRLAQPPVRAYQASFKPGSALPFGWCDLGDKVTLAISAPALLALSATRRVMQIGVMPQAATGDEVVSLTFNLPLDQLGT